MDENEKPVKEHMARLIDTFARLLPDSMKVNESLWKFAKMHDRRSYQLIRFCMAPESDYRTVVKAIVSLTLKLGDSSGRSNGCHRKSLRSALSNPLPHHRNSSTSSFPFFIESVSSCTIRAMSQLSWSIQEPTTNLWPRPLMSCSERSPLESQKS